MSKQTCPTRFFSIPPSLPVQEMTGIPTLYPKLLQPKDWAAFPYLVILVTRSFCLPFSLLMSWPCPLPSLLQLTWPGPGTCSLWALPDVSACGSAFPFICNNLSAPPYLGVVMSFLYFLFSPTSTATTPKHASPPPPPGLCTPGWPQACYIA